MLQQSVGEIVTFSIECLFFGFLLSIIIVFACKFSKELNSAFYHLLLMGFLVDFIYFVVMSVMFIKLTRFGFWGDLYKKAQFMGSVAFTFSAYLSCCQYFQQTMLAFNRFTCLWMPMNHKKIWHFKWYIFMGILCPIIPIIYRFGVDGKIDVSDDGQLIGGYADSDTERTALKMTAFFYTLNLGIAIGLSLLTVYKYIRIRKTVSNLSMDKSVGLLVYSLLLLSVQLVKLICNRVRDNFVSDYGIVQIVLFILPYINDAHAAVSAVAIMILSPLTRKVYAEFYFSCLKHCLIGAQTLIGRDRTQILPF